MRHDEATRDLPEALRTRIRGEVRFDADQRLFAAGLVAAGIRPRIETCGRPALCGMTRRPEICRKLSGRASEVRSGSMPIRGSLQPDLSRPGLGLELKRADAQRYAA